MSTEENKAIASHTNEELWNNMAVTRATPRPPFAEKLVVRVAPSPALVREGSGL